MHHPSCHDGYRQQRRRDQSDGVYPPANRSHPIAELPAAIGEHAGQSTGGLRASGRVRRQQRAQQVHQRPGHAGGAELVQRQRAVQSPVAQFVERSPGERRAAGQGVPECRTQREEIRACVEFLPDVEMLRTGEGRCADEIRHTGQVRVAGRIFVGGLGEAEVDDLDVDSLDRDEHEIGRLEVPVRHPARLGRREGVRHLCTDLQHGVRRQSAAPAHAGVEGLAIDEFHRVEGLAVPGALAEKQHAGDVRMTQTRRGARLPQKPGARAWVFRQFRVDHLQRHRAAQRRIPRAERDTHGAPAEFDERPILPRVDLVMRKPGPDRLRDRCWLVGGAREVRASNGFGRLEQTPEAQSPDSVARGGERLAANAANGGRRRRVHEAPEQKTASFERKLFLPESYSVRKAARR